MEFVPSLFRPTIVYSIYIVSTPERVWQALTTPDLTPQFFFGRRIESDWQVGSPWALVMEDGQIDSQGKVVECDPPRRLSITWRVEWVPEMRDLPEGLVTYEVEPMGDVVRLTMTQSNQEPIDEKMLEGGRQGWPFILSGLKTLLETGKPMPKVDWPE